MVLYRDYKESIEEGDKKKNMSISLLRVVPVLLLELGTINTTNVYERINPLFSSRSSPTLFPFLIIPKHILDNYYILSEL